jgi:uncharacterized protein (TIGR00106 family)
MIAEFTVVPLDRGPHLTEWLAPVLDIVDESGVDYRFTAMGTILEGDWDQIMATVKRCHDKVRESSERVVTTIKIDDHAGRSKRIRGKVESVEKHLGRGLKTD